MSTYFNYLARITLFVASISLLFSCSKDADLLSEYVINDDDDVQSLTILTNDSFYMAPGQNTILMDVLNNDNVEPNTTITIIETSTPINGIVTINDDNTLTYRSGETTPEETTPEETTPEETTPEETTPEETTPEETTPEETTPVDDTFTYTAEVVDEETGNVTQEEATVTISSTSPSVIDMGELLAFPGAEGFGKYATGGRGGKVLHVTNLNDSGPGSLREAFNTSGPRTIVFDVGGDIFLESNLTIWEERGSASGNITIAGETAPYPGITLRNKGIQIHNSNVIIRYLTIRLNEVRDSENTWDCIRIRNWGTGDKYIENFMFDHLSLSHGDDEIFNPNGHASDSNYGTRKITMQNSTIGKPNNEYNVLVGTYVYDISFINNYFHNSADRSVLFGYGWNQETSEFINNIIYGYNYGTTIAYGTITDVIGNLYKPYPWRGQNNAIGYGPNVYNNPNGIESNGSLFVSENFVLENDAVLYDGNAKTFTKNNRVLNHSLKQSWESTPSAIEDLVLKSVGNSIYRDELDQKYINNYFEGTGDWNIDPIPNKSSTKREDNYDTDLDGMADAWELIRFGNLNHNSNGDENSDGYTNLEEFLHSLTITN